MQDLVVNKKRQLTFKENEQVHQQQQQAIEFSLRQMQLEKLRPRHREGTPTPPKEMSREARAMAREQRRLERELNKGYSSSDQMWGVRRSTRNRRKIETYSDDEEDDIDLAAFSQDVVIEEHSWEFHCICGVSGHNLVCSSF